jgi:predicted metal-dependent HD superfamily phosphohydrolase
VKTRREEEIVTLASRHVRKLFREKLPGWAFYHSLAHTLDVVAAVREIGTASGLTRHEMEILSLASWFHDAGYSVQPEGHEEISIAIATEFLTGAGYPKRGIARIARCIRATRIPQRPRSLLERVIGDADLSSLGKRSFFRQNDLLKREIEERRGGIRLDEKMWLRRSSRFLQRHRFHTRYARTHLDGGRLENIARLKKALRAL